MPNMDDFGIVAVEAMAAGTPVIAYKKGGSLDYVVPGKTGLFFDQQTVGNLRNTLETAMNKSFDYQSIADRAEQFSVTNFRKNLRIAIEDCLKQNKEKSSAVK
jgi:glycosyltransferase involved in cell wall biosynthesis